jgi:hypothetical protein
MLYTDFLTEEARAILARGGNLSELPADHNPIHSESRNSVENLADQAMGQAQNLPANEASLADRWTAERGRRDSIVRGGLPEELLREIVNARLDAWQSAGAPNFESAARVETMRTEAERRAGERSAYERGIPELMRRIGR